MQMNGPNYPIEYVLVENNRWTTHAGETITEAPVALTVNGEVTLAGTPRTVEVTWTGGLTPVAPVRDVLPGESSHTLRILDFGATDVGWHVKVEGDAGGEYDLRLAGERPARATGAAIVDHAGGLTTLRVRLPRGDALTTVAELVLFRR